jgi:hypothetical protein
MKESEKVLVLDQYPYAFVQEFWQTIGALFFISKRASIAR